MGPRGHLETNTLGCEMGEGDPSSNELKQHTIIYQYNVYYTHLTLEGWVEGRMEEAQVGVRDGVPVSGHLLSHCGSVPLLTPTFPLSSFSLPWHQPREDNGGKTKSCSHDHYCQQ